MMRKADEEMKGREAKEARAHQKERPRPEADPWTPPDLEQLQATGGIERQANEEE